jgi:hypothetical protein
LNLMIGASSERIVVSTAKPGTSSEQIVLSRRPGQGTTNG